MINQRLFDHYGIDTTKDLKIRHRCPRPSDTVLIDRQGSCYACECQSWLPQSIGNLQVKPLKQIIHSAMHRHLQSSIDDGTYRYCNAKQCSYILSKSDFQFGGGHSINLRLAIDNSCNLRCPSCRPQMIFNKSGSAYDLGIRLADRVNEWLWQYNDSVQVHMGSDGDPFASHVYRHFMQTTPRQDNIKYSILTNGLMFKEFHPKVPKVIANLNELGISIDGATKDTYEKLRLGGKWEKILENLEAMAEAKNKHGFKFVFHFVVQKDNFHEMEDIIDLAEKYNADHVWLNKIEDWGTMENFDEQSIWNTEQFQSCIEKVIARIRARTDRFIECPTLISEAARYRNRN